MCLYVLEALYFCLANDLKKPSEITADWIEANVPIIFLRRQSVLTVTDLVTGLKKTKAGAALVKNELEALVNAFVNYPTFQRAFSPGQADHDPVDEFKKVHRLDSRISQLMTDFLYDTPERRLRRED